jgi:hypothetical protein
MGVITVTENGQVAVAGVTKENVGVMVRLLLQVAVQLLGVGEEKKEEN